MDMTQLAPNLFVGAQIAEEDLGELARKGFTDVVCNRPDAEHPGRAPSSRMAGVAKGRVLAFQYLPITPGESFTAEADVLSKLVARPGTKVLAYCRSGTRAPNAWSLTRVNESAGRP